MTSGAADWTVRLTHIAEDDFKLIVRWTLEHFGERQARAYSVTLSTALMDLVSGPEQAGVRNRDEIAKGILSLHVARHGRKGRHFIMFRVANQRDKIIEVLRLLHDAMDLPQHLPHG